MVLDDLRERIARLSPAKRALFELQLLKRGGEAGRAIPRRELASPCPLSFGQHRLWFLEQLDPEGFVYNEPKALRLVGPLDVDALRRAVEAIVARHEILRTTFHAVDGSPVQVIADSRSVDLPIVDIPPGAASAREEAVHRAMSEEIQRPFDLEHGPLLRMTLLRMSATEHILLVVVHHIIWDGWAARVFFQELGELYGAYRAGRPPRLPQLPIQYADFAVWQRQRLEGSGLETQIRYWTDRLAGAPALLDLPTDRPRPARQTHRGAWVPFALSRPLSDAVTTLSRRHGATTFMTLLAALQAVLSRYSGQDDVVVGAPIASRTRSELEGLIGFFANTLALRADLSGDPTFVELLGRVRDVALGAYEHQEVPFERLVEELQPERDLSRSPIFQVTFGLQSTPPTVPDLVDLVVETVPVGAPAAKFDLTMLMHESPDGLAGRLEYSTDLFDAETVTRLLGHFHTLLEGVVADPDRPISRLPLLTESERRQILIEWNDTAVDYPRERCIHELFEEQVRRDPNAVALIFEGQSLTYAELNRRANQLAHRLMALGVGPGSTVGVLVERSPEMIVALLATLKAGGAYVPLEPSYPKTRLALMLKDTGSRIVLTQDRVAHRLPRRKLTVVYLDADTVDEERGENPARQITAESLAYVMYTSGSTGQPKGVAVPHRAICRLVLNTDYVQPGPSDVIAQVSNYAFDAATFEIWGALLNGARLVIIPQTVLLSLSDFRDQVNSHKISILFLTTALFNEFARYLPTAFGSLRCLLFGGEAVDPGWVREVLRCGRPGRLLHVYGPTETTTFATWHQVESVPEDATTVPIGRPIANTQAYVLDMHLRPTPIGVPGELYIGGDGVADGYLNQPALTAELFVPDQFGPRSRKLYRTGDLVRWLADGSLQFVGRRDNQVKIRGFRVELGEIESVLVQHPRVQEGVVLAHRDLLGEMLVTAWVVPHPEQALAPDDLRHFLKRRLPGYMVPHTFVSLPALPLTAHGKIDRSALPMPEWARLDRVTDGAAPKSMLELRLTTLWEDVLNVRPVGVRDDFFNLGGHSLLAVRLFARIEQISGKRLPLATIFQAPTIEQLATVLNQEGWSPPESSLVVIQAGGSKPPFFCVHPGGGNIVGYALLARHLGPDQPFYGLQPRRLAGEVVTDVRVEDMAAHYLEEIKRVQPQGPYFLGGRCFGGIIAFEMAQQLLTEGREVALLAILDSGPPRTRLPVRARSSTKLRTAWERPLDELRARHRRASVAYAARPYPGSITLIRSSEFRDRSTKGWQIAAWTELAGDGLKTHVVEGSHLSMFREPHVRTLAEQLQTCIDNARRGDDNRA
jgi:amino acid adenylation domain-containing protein